MSKTKNKGDKLQYLVLNKMGFRLANLVKVPINFISGMRLDMVDDEQAIVKIKHGFINQNPFGSMFWAVQGMTAEFATALVLIHSMKKKGQSVSFLVSEQHAKFYKPAKGRIRFICKDGQLAYKTIEEVIASGQSQKVEMKSVGYDANDDMVSEFTFLWSLKA